MAFHCLKHVKDKDGKKKYQLIREEYNTSGMLVSETVVEEHESKSNAIKRQADLIAIEEKKGNK